MILSPSWKRLARRYRAQPPIPRPDGKLQIARVGSAFCLLSIHGDREGLGLKAAFPPGLARDALWVPWDELLVSTRSAWGREGWEFDFKSVPGVTLWVGKGLGQRILRSASGIPFAPPRRPDP